MNHTLMIYAELTKFLKPLSKKETMALMKFIEKGVQNIFEDAKNNKYSAGDIK